MEACIDPHVSLACQRDKTSLGTHLESEHFQTMSQDSVFGPKETETPKIRTAGNEENEENQGVALNKPLPWQAQYIVCYESSWSCDIELQILMPKLPSTT